MTKKIAITGGKGGTGKTLIATNIATQLYLEGKKILLIDCDTENPNTNILLGRSLDEEGVEKEQVNIFVPRFNYDQCTQCGLCKEACYRHAILQFPGQYPSVMEHMCSGCTVCQRVCPANAIVRGDHGIGNTYFIRDVFKVHPAEGEPTLDLLVGELKEGEALSVMIVEHLLEMADNLNGDSNSGEKYDYIIIDTPPGAHCDVEHSLEAADIIVAVTEPTPFGAHDLTRILDLIHLLDKQANIILNRADLTAYKDEIMNISERYNAPLIGEIPLSREIIEDYARGIPFVKDNRSFIAKERFLEIYRLIVEKVKITS